MICPVFHLFIRQSLDFQGQAADNPEYIRPLAVRPLNYPEGVPNPWGFLVSGPSTRTVGGFGQ